MTSCVRGMINIMCNKLDAIRREFVYPIVHDELQLRFFYDWILPDLLPTEAYFLSLSCRNKYLTDEEREHYSVGRTEMFKRTVVHERDWLTFYRTVKQFEVSREGYTGRTGVPLPDKALVCYININPTDTVAVYEELSAKLAKIGAEGTRLTYSGKSQDSLTSSLLHLDSMVRTLYQQNMKRKVWMDIDFDVPQEYPWAEFSKTLDTMGLPTHYWIATRSGYHLLIYRDELKFDPSKICQAARDLYKERLGPMQVGEEIVVNKNAMVPLPGTYQAGYPVVILNIPKQE